MIERIPSHDMLVVMGDWNAKVGKPYRGEEGIVGRYTLAGDRTDNVRREICKLLCSQHSSNNFNDVPS